MKPIINFSPNRKIDFIKFKSTTIAVSMLVMLVSIIGGWFWGLQYGIDFKGGYLIELRSSEAIAIEEVRSHLDNLHIKGITLQEFGDKRDLLIKLVSNAQDDKQNTEDIAAIKQALAQVISGQIEYRRIDVVGPTIGEELLHNSIYAIVFALLAMLVYIWIRFEWQFGVCAIIALVHDCFAILCFYVVGRSEFNTTAIVAILLTAGYSINDTVVIYDRIRENLRKYKRMPFPELFNLSINETLSRTILTSSTTLLALLVLWLCGGEIIAAYSLPLIVGVSFGTYSSICLAAPLLLSFDLNFIRNKPDKALSTQPNENEL